MLDSSDAMGRSGKRRHAQERAHEKPRVKPGAEVVQC